jgi:hypothetical protein
LSFKTNIILSILIWKVYFVLLDNFNFIFCMWHCRSVSVLLETWLNHLDTHQMLSISRMRLRH